MITADHWDDIFTDQQVALVVIGSKPIIMYIKILLFCNSLQ